MLLEVISPYIPLLVVGVFWLVAIRPLVRPIHVAPSPARPAPRRHGRRPAR
jgi:hypothetical protein